MNPAPYQDLVNGLGYALGGGGNDSFTKLLLHMDGTPITDSAQGTAKTVSNTGVVVVSSPAKFGSSGYFPGSSLTIPDIQFGSSDFTIDFWIYPNNLTAPFPFTERSGGNVNLQGGVNSGLSLYYNSVSYSFSAGTPSLSQWSHVAFVRNGNNLDGYLNGHKGTTATISGSMNTTGIGFIIGHDNATNYYAGYIDEFRISKGIARWTTDFTPPSGPYY
jgi:hypothetical protein